MRMPVLRSWPHACEEKKLMSFFVLVSGQKEGRIVIRCTVSGLEQAISYAYILFPFNLSKAGQTGCRRKFTFLLEVSSFSVRRTFSFFQTIDNFGSPIFNINLILSCFSIDVLETF